MVVNILLQQFPNVSIKLKNVPSSKEASTIGLEFNYQIRDSQISLFFQMSQDTGSEENLGLTNSIQIAIEFESCYHIFTCLFAIHESLGDHIGSQEFVTLPKLLERNSEKDEQLVDLQIITHFYLDRYTCWGILDDKYECLPRHHCTLIGPKPRER